MGCADVSSLVGGELELIENELSKLLDAGESGTVEFKESFGREAIETICAFANSGGGFLCVGVSDKGEITGVDAPEGVIKDWLNQLKMATDPPLFPQFTIVEAGHLKVVVFTIQEYPLKPVSCKGRYFRLNG